MSIHLEAQQGDIKGVEILEGHMMPDHVHMLVAMPPKISVLTFMGYLREKFANDL